MIAHAAFYLAEEDGAAWDEIDEQPFDVAAEDVAFTEQRQRRVLGDRAAELDANLESFEDVGLLEFWRDEEAFGDAAEDAAARLAVCALASASFARRSSSMLFLSAFRNSERKDSTSSSSSTVPCALSAATAVASVTSARA